MDIMETLSGGLGVSQKEAGSDSVDNEGSVFLDGCLSHLARD